MPTILHKILLLAAVTSVLLLSGCGGDDGKDGVPGANGADGSSGMNGADGSAGADGSDGANGSDGTNGLQSLVRQSVLPVGDMQCFKGGVRIDSGLDSNGDLQLHESEVTDSSYVCHPGSLNSSKNFVRIASFPVCLQLQASCDTDTQTAAEIVAASVDGLTLIYSDSPAQQIGFIDISNPATPLAAGVVALTGEPTSVAVKQGFVLVGINTSADLVNVSGHLQVFDIATQTSVRSIDLGGQPDSVAVSPDGNYAAIAVENERDEDLGDGVPPQLPAGNFVIVDISSADPANWTSSSVDLTGLADLYPGDPEPEYVDINDDNIAVLSLQENNYIVLIDLSDGSIVNHFSAGTANLTQVDLSEGALRIQQTESQDNIPREPDGVSWINSEYFVTADEGDLDGGSRGFTVFDTAGNVVWEAGNDLEHLTARLGHYPDARSGNKGNEPENVELGIFGDERFLFVNSERSSVVFVYDVADPRKPVFKQALPAATGPEGGLAIPARNLLVVASEEDERGDALRSSINIYRYGYQQATYPTVISEDREDGTPIPWGAMSGLAADPINAKRLYAIEDSFYTANRIFEIQLNDAMPAVITGEIAILDSDNVFAETSVVAVDSGTAANDASRLAVFDSVDLAAMINDDKTVNIDPEGIATASDGGFWIASEGAGTMGDVNRPINSLNLIFKTDAQGVIEGVVRLPNEVNDLQQRFGFEGIAEWNGLAVVAFQRAWGDEANPRIGLYNVAEQSWSFVFYPLDAVSSQNGGWVGLSDITALGDGEFLVVERDNQGGPDAAVKRLYRINLTDVVADSTISKTLARDLMDELSASGGLIPEKIEGSAVTPSGEVYIINDNDGIDGVSGETRLLKLGTL